MTTPDPARPIETPPLYNAISGKLVQDGEVEMTVVTDNGVGPMTVRCVGGRAVAVRVPGGEWEAVNDITPRPET